jgi:uncharacterized integral membrane protein
MDIEKQLEGALRAQDPGPAFTAAVLAKLSQPAVMTQRPASRWRLPLSLAASVLAAVLGGLLIERQLQQNRIEAASEQLVLALTITSQQLNEVQQKLSRNDSQENGI